MSESVPAQIPAKRTHLEEVESSGPAPDATDSPAPRKQPKKKGKWANDTGSGRKGRGGKRWAKDEPARAPRDPSEKKERLAKRKCAILIGFCGAGYSGMQIQQGPHDQNTKTIEGTLFKALVEAGAVSQDNADDATKVALSRAARTDAGVHAAGNAVSMKMITSIPTLIEAGIDLVDHINSLLPPEMRVWEILRTTNHFNARTSCDSRIYEYLFPSYVLIPPSPTSPLAQNLVRVNASLASTATLFPTSTSSQNDFNIDNVSARKTYRASAEDLEHLRETMAALSGTHNFHNYTIGRDFSDRSCQRYMMDLQVRDPVIYEDGVEWISIKFHGQSFMLHQIRKMIGMAMLATRARTPVSLIPETYGPSRIHIPKAPALGLLLEEPQFGMYNLKAEETNKAMELEQAAKAASQAQAQTSEPSGETKNEPEEHSVEGIEEAVSAEPGSSKPKPASDAQNATLSTTKNDTEQQDLDANSNRREQIDFSKHASKIAAFKLEMIYKRMRAEEAQHAVFARWVSMVDTYGGPDFEYLNSKGIIPPSAVVSKRKPGTTRDNGFKEYITVLKKDGAEGEVEMQAEEDEELSRSKDVEMEG